MVMKGIEVYELRKLCYRVGVDTAEIDTSITYSENRAHLATFELRKKFDEPSKEYAKWVSSSQNRRLSRDENMRVSRQEYNTRAVCPTCGRLGSGFHLKWVLNWQRKKYYPYYYFAHSSKKKGQKATKWCYIRKKKALEIQSSYELKRKYGLK
ncbi:hypothetical protein ES705_33134 [subsurface metagenome]